MLRQEMADEAPGPRLKPLPIAGALSCVLQYRRRHHAVSKRALGTPRGCFKNRRPSEETPTLARQTFPGHDGRITSAIAAALLWKSCVLQYPYPSTAAHRGSFY
jgi:hypothetical protein